MTQAISRILVTFAVQLPIQAVFEAPTVLAMAQRIEQLQQQGTPLTFPPIRRMSPQDTAVPLSYAQQRLWFIDQLEPGQATYNIPAAVRIQGTTGGCGLWRGAVVEVVHRHATLRTHFHSGGGRTGEQVIEAGVFMELPVFDLSRMTEENREAEAQRLAALDARTPFDLEHAPLLRVRLLQLSAEDHILVMTMHHIISDGWSLGVLVREASVLYRAFSAGEPSPLPELAIQYVDFSAWQREWLSGEILGNNWSTGRSGWKELRRDWNCRGPTAARGADEAAGGAQQKVKLERGLVEEFRKLSRREGATLYMVLLAAFQTLLYRYSGQRDIVVGSPIAGRTQTETEGLIGFFVNTLVMRTEVGEFEFPGVGGAGEGRDAGGLRTPGCTV